MESKGQGVKRKERQQDAADSHQIQAQSNEDVDMSEQQPQRKIIKVKKRVTIAQEVNETGAVLVDEETGEAIEFEGEVEGENEHFIDEEDVVQNDDDDDDWQDEGDDNDSDEVADAKQKKEIWDEKKAPLQEGEELVFDNSAYQMLHRAKVEWPCLSIDVLLPDRINNPNNKPQNWFPQYVHQFDPKHSYKGKDQQVTHRTDKFPYTVYFCAGSQSLKKNENKIYVLKWSDMHKTLKDDDVSSGEDEDEETAKDPVMRFETIPHRGCVNRIRSMHGSGIVATWSDENEVGIYDVSQAVEALDQPVNKNRKPLGGNKLAGFKYTDEGYALDWSPLTFGRLAAGSCNSQIHLFTPADENCSSFVKEIQGGLQSHKKSVEDVQFSPSQEQVLASCSVDQTVKLWDLRATQMKAQISFRAHDCDVNVLSWNTTSKFLLASGDDKGEFRIWDLRMLDHKSFNQSSSYESITRIRWHTSAITSLQFEPGEDSVLAVASADNKLTIWDFSVEVDENEQMQDEEEDIPPQLMFLHQGQENIKELRFHPYYREMLITTAEDSYNVFRPNLEPDEQEEDRSAQHSEAVSTTDQEESKTQKPKKSQDYYVDSEEEDEKERQKFEKAAKKLNKQLNAEENEDQQSKKDKKKRRKMGEDDEL